MTEQRPALQAAVRTAESGADAAALERARKALRVNRTEHFNQLLDAGVAGVFLVLVGMIVLLSVREWASLLGGRQLAKVHESEPVWLPSYAQVETPTVPFLGLFALSVALMKELAGEAAMERIQQTALCCDSGHEEPGGTIRDHTPTETDSGANRARRAYLAMTENRFDGIRRCC